MISSRSIVAAVVVWVGLHQTLMVRGLDRSTLPLVDLAAGVLAVVAIALAVSPLLGRPVELSAAQAAGLAAAYVAVAAGVTLSLTPVGYVGYANWWPGGCGPLLAALVLRRRAPAAVAASAGGVVVLAVGAALTQPPSTRVGAAIALAVPVVLWPLAAVAARAAFDRATRTIADLDRGTASAQERVRREDATDGAAAVMVDQALPVLAAIAAGRTPSVAAAAHAHALERAIRDELRGGTLLDPVSRDHVRALRRDGWHVAVDDHGAYAATGGEDRDGEAVPAVAREVLDATLAACRFSAAAGRLAVTAPTDPGTSLTVLVVAPAAVLDAVTTAVQHALGHVPGWMLDLERDDAAGPGRDATGQLWFGLTLRG